MPTLPVHLLVVPDDLGGIQVADYLERELPGIDRAGLRRLIQDGTLKVNGLPASLRRRLRPGDLVDLGMEPAALRVRRPAPPPELVVLHETAHLLVVDKPAGLPTVPDRSGREQGVHGLLLALRPGADLRIAHRLDRDTSGCLVLAKGLEAARHLDYLFRGGSVQKQYLALVAGYVPRDDFAIELYLGPDPGRPGKVVASDRLRKGFRTARTDVTVERRFADHTLLRLLPRTGRGHQLRVHLAAVGHPIAGDTDYGGEPLLLSRLKRGYKRRPRAAETPLLSRLFLHAAAITLVDLDGAAVAVHAPLPADLQGALDKLERFAAPRR